MNNTEKEIDLIVSAAHALELDSPIIHYRIVGDRIELWTCHGGPFIYLPSPLSGGTEGGKKPVRKKKP